MSKLQIEITKLRWVRKPLVRTFTVDVDEDFGGQLWISKKQAIEVKVTLVHPD